jgi:nucleolin
MKSQRRQHDSDDESLSESLSDRQQKGREKRGRDERSQGKQDRRQRKSSDDEDNSVEEESKETGEHSELFMKNLSYDSNEKSLKSFFSKFGSVTNVKILKRDDGKSKGIGFIGFASRKDAQKVLDEADNLDCDGRKILVSWSNEKPQRENNNSFRQKGNDRGGDQESSNTVFMGNLSFNTTEDSIRKFFKDCGKVVHVRIAKTPEGKMKGFCHVEFEDNGSAGDACSKNGLELDGRQVRIDMSRPQGQSKIIYKFRKLRR